MAVKIRVSEDEYSERTDGSEGVCLACGAWRGECEPDAEDYPCEACGEASVYGAEQALLIGALEIA